MRFLKHRVPGEPYSVDWALRGSLYPSTLHTCARCSPGKVKPSSATGPSDVVRQLGRGACHAPGAKWTSVGWLLGL